jgi:hypothetical protein
MGLHSPAALSDSAKLKFIRMVSSEAQDRCVLT